MKRESSTMKILRVENGRAFCSTGETATKSVKDIDEEDVLSLVNLILHEDDCELDPVPSSEECLNDAERVIYEELYKQFSSILKKRKDILESIDNQFSEAEALYDTDKPAKSMDEWNSDN